MTRLLCLFAIVLPLMAVDVTITAGAQSETFTVTADDIAAVTALRASRVDKDDMCPALKKSGGVLHDCSTGTKYIMWKIKQLINHAKKNHPQGADAVDGALILTLTAAIEARKVE